MPFIISLKYADGSIHGLLVNKIPRNTTFNGATFEEIGDIEYKLMKIFRGIEGYVYDVDLMVEYKAFIEYKNQTSKRGACIIKFEGKSGFHDSDDPTCDMCDVHKHVIECTRSLYEPIGSPQLKILKLYFECGKLYPESSKLLDKYYTLTSTPIPSTWFYNISSF